LHTAIKEDGMSGDRYLRFILTIIACELLWLGVKDVGSYAQAQAPPEPTPVVITGFRSGNTDYNTLPVAVAGGIRIVPGSTTLPGLETMTVQVGRPVKIEADSPIKIEADKPLRVESVEYRSKSRPGE
jgi:hypothetical protein